MKTLKFRLYGDYGHFKIPYTNNNPLTYSFITKTALIGLMGAVVGIERREMKSKFPILSDNLKYSVSINKELIKESISLNLCNLSNYCKGRKNKSPKPMEYLKNPDWTIYVSLCGKDEEAKKIFEAFCNNMEEGIYIWRPTLGIKQCTCTFKDVETFDVIEKEGNFSTKTFAKTLEKFNKDISIYQENVPTHQDENWFNDPEKNVSVYFSDNSQSIESSGTFYAFKDENIVLI